MRLSLELIDKTRALELLKTMPTNRNVKKANLNKLISVLENDEWDAENGEVIKINKQGQLIDGQHRLMAIVKTNKAVKMAIMYGCGSNAMKTIDTGATRSINDVLKLNNVKSYVKVPFVIQSESVIKLGKTIRYTNQETKYKTALSVLDVYLNNKIHIDDTITNATRYYAELKLLAPSQVVAYFNIFKKIDEESAIDFFSQLSSFNISNTQILLLKQRLIADKTTTLRKLSSTEKEAFIIKTWNAFMRGTENKILRWQPSTEDFPKVYGIENINHWL